MGGVAQVNGLHRRLMCVVVVVVQICHLVTGERQTLITGQSAHLSTFHYNDYFVDGGVCTCLGISNDPLLQ